MPGVSFKALKYKGHVLCCTETVQKLLGNCTLQFRSQMKHFCARNYMLKVFKERALSFEVL